MTDLDDFFAKKDKRKCGSEGKRTLTKPPGIKSITPVQIGLKLLEDCDVKRKNRCDSRGAEDEDDEWKPFDSEEKKDYSGLKIQELVLPETDEADPEISDENRKQPNGPWKIADIPTTLTEESSNGAYVNPIQRVIGKKPEIRVSHAAPDVKSNIVFPTLSEGLKGGLTNQNLNKRIGSLAEQNRETEPEEKGSRNWSTDTEGQQWKISRNGPRNIWDTETKHGQISRNGPRQTFYPEIKQGKISRNGSRNINNPEFENREISRNSVESKPNEISRNSPRNTIDTDPKPFQISRNGSVNTALEDSMPNPTQLYKIPINRLNTPKTNVGRNGRGNLNPTGGEGRFIPILEGRLIEYHSEPAPRVGKYLPPGLRQKFSTQMGS